LTEIPECPYCHKRDFASRGSRDVHVYRERKKSESTSANDKIDQIFESFGKPKYESMFEEKKVNKQLKSTEPKETPKTKSNLRQFWREEMERKIEEFKEGKFKDEEDCASEYLTVLQTEGMEKNIAFRFYDHLKKRLYALNQTQFVAPQPNSQPQSQPREISITERAELEAAKINTQRGFALRSTYACEVCHRDGLSYEEAVACENSHQVATTTQTEPETHREQESEIERQPQPQTLPQSDILFRLGKSLVDRLRKTNPEPKKTEEEQQMQETESYSPITYLSTVRWQAPEPIESQECKICGRIDYISNFRAGLHGRGVCN
jgi:hypothetical protein